MDREDNVIDLHWRRYARNKPERCPHCGSENLVPIAYGLPGKEMMEAAKRGLIALGGCVVIEGRPAWSCNDCHKRCGKVTS